MLKYDLHCHSTASDGILTPTEVVLRAHEKGVNVLALTGIGDRANGRIPRHHRGQRGVVG